MPLLHGRGWLNMPSHFPTDHGSGRMETTTSYSLPVSPKLVNTPTRHRTISDERPFNVITRKLKEIGAVPLEDFLSNTSAITRPRVHTSGPVRYDTWSTSNTDIGGALRTSAVNDGDRSPSPSLVPAPLSERNMNGDVKSTCAFPRDNAISRLHQTCIHTFGSADTLKYEFLEENGQKSKQCILTITRSDGQVRSYKSEPVFLRRADAKARVATVAVQMGALAFILNGDSDSVKDKKQSFLLTSGTGNTGAHDKPDPSTPEGLIDKCLLEWRAGKIHPEWILYNDSRVVGHYGAALRIQLTKHSLRVYSCDSIFNSESDAKAACAQKALNEGVLDYIKFGNGQKEPVQLCLEDREPELFDQQRLSTKLKTRPVTLQSYYESLPQPFPESFGSKPAAEINAPSYINTLLQSARGGRLKYNFYWIMDKSSGLLGCLLRLERGEETKSYFVDCIFQKRNDAKAAACLLALSQGLGDYIRSVKASMDANFTPEMRKLASEKFIFALNTECSKIRQGNRLNFTYTDDLDAFGASLEIDISCNPEAPDYRKWSVPAEYRSKNDAKMAVCYQAVAQGAIEVLQFKGASPPPGHISYWDVVHGKGTVRRAAKRKTTEVDVSGESFSQQKKRRKDLQKIERNTPELTDKEQSDNFLSRSPSGDSNRPKRLEEKKPHHVRLQELNGGTPHDPSNSPCPTSGKRSPRHIIPSSPPGPESFPLPQTPYYPPVIPGAQYPLSPHQLTPTTTPSPLFYQPSASSPIAFTTYHPHPAMPEQFIPHPQMYHPHFLSGYPQPTASPYHPIPSPYHSPYVYPPSSPLYPPSPPDSRLMEVPDYRPDIRYHHSPQAQVQPMPSSPPSGPPRPQRIKRIDRNTALSPLKVAETLTELKEVARQSVKEQMQDVADRSGENAITGRGAECLEPGELTEAEAEVMVEKRQVLERRASMP